MITLDLCKLDLRNSLANVKKDDFLSGDIVHFGRWIHMKDNSIQPVVTVRRRVAGRVLLETALVALIGMVFAFAANWLSPRGLALARNYFPTGTNNLIQSPVSVSSRRIATNQNSTALSPEELLAAQMKQKGLRLVDHARTVQFFHESQLKGSVIFVDARDSSQYRQGHIPGAYEFNPYRPENYFPSVMPVCQTAEQIVVYCNGGNCDDSQTAALLLRDVGIPNRKIFVYGGGITEWTNNRLPVEIGDRNSGNLQK